MVIRILLVAAWCLAWGLSSGFAQEPDKAPVPNTGTLVEPNSQSPELQNAILNFRNKKYEEARASLEDARKKDPKLAPADIVMAALFVQSNDLANALTFLEKAVISEPNEPDAYLSFATLELQQQRVTPAAVLFEKGFSLAEKYTGNADRKKDMLQRANMGLANVAEFRQDWKSAEKYLRAWLVNSPNDPTAGTRLGRALFNQKTADSIKEAYKVFQDLHEANKKEVVFADVNMAVLFQQADDLKRSQAFISEAIKKDGKNPATRLAATRWALDTGDLKMAEENAKAARELDQSSFQSNFYSGLVARFQKNYAEAERYFTLAHGQKPSNPQVNNQLALVLIELDGDEKHQLAVEYANLNSRSNSDLKQQPGREAAVTLGWVLHRLNRAAEADSAIQQALQSGSVGSESGYYAARILMDRGRSDLAKRILEEALKAKGTFADKNEAQELVKKLGG